MLNLLYVGLGLQGGQSEHSDLLMPACLKQGTHRSLRACHGLAMLASCTLAQNSMSMLAAIVLAASASSKREVYGDGDASWQHSWYALLSIT